MHHSTSAFVAFILIVIGIYVSIHAYVYHRMCTALELGRISNLIVGIFFIIMVFSPFIIRISERGGPYILSVFFSYTGYTWMGIMAVLVLSLFFFDILHLILIKFAHHLNFYERLPPHIDKYTFLISSTISLIVSVIGFFEAHNIRETKINLASRYLPKEHSPLKIVQISDVHISQTLGGNFIADIVARVKKLNPDIVVITGDITDIDPRKNKKIINELSALNPPLGKYAITGNHEFYAGIDMATEFYKICGFRLLRGEYIKITDGIVIMGVDDENGKRFDNYSNVTEERLIEQIPSDSFLILLKHQPSVLEQLKGRIDLQLSGHTHGGQIFPFSLIVKTVYKYFSGLYRISDRMSLYVSRGTGYWGPPIRFLAPPEITLFEIENSD
ncbi:MAG: metallophosphoesterase [Myxococcota bacterium]